MLNPAMAVCFTIDEATFVNQKWAPSLLKKLQEMRSENVFCDVALEVQESPDDTRLILPAHACVLAAGSELFHGILEREAKPRRVYMKSFNKHILQACLDYVYGQEVKIAVTEIKNLKTAAETLQIKTLILQCSVALEAVAKQNQNLKQSAAGTQEAETVPGKISKAVDDTTKELVPCVPESPQVKALFSRNLPAETEKIRHDESTQASLSEDATGPTNSINVPECARNSKSVPVVSVIMPVKFRSEGAVSNMSLSAPVNTSNVSEMAPINTESLLVNSENSHVNPEKSPANSVNSFVSSDNLLANSEKSPVNSGCLPVSSENFAIDSHNSSVSTENSTVISENLSARSDNLPVNSENVPFISDNEVEEPTTPPEALELSLNTTNRNLMITENSVTKIKSTKINEIKQIEKEEMIKSTNEDIEADMAGNIIKITPVTGKEKLASSTNFVKRQKPVRTLNVKGKAVPLKDLPPAVRRALKGSVKRDEAPLASKASSSCETVAAKPALPVIPTRPQPLYVVGKPLPNVPVLVDGKLVIPQEEPSVIANLTAQGPQSGSSLLLFVGQSLPEIPIFTGEKIALAQNADTCSGTSTVLDSLKTTGKENAMSDSEKDEEKGWKYKHRGKPMKCDHCGRCFAGQAGLREHMARVKRNPYLRAPPSRSKEEQLEKKKQARERLKNKIYTCDQCKETFQGWKKLFVHKQMVHRKALACQHCGRTFAYPNSLKVHERRHAEEKNYLCCHCDFRAVTKKEVEHHEQLNHLDETYPCSHCSAVFKCEQYRQRHVRVVHVKGPVKCAHCDYTSLSASYLKRHIMNKHFPDERTLLPCAMCGKEFTCKGHLDRHVRDVHRCRPKHKGRHKVASSRVPQSVVEDTDTTVLLHAEIARESALYDEPQAQDNVVMLEDGIVEEYLASVVMVRESDGSLHRADGAQSLDNMPHVTGIGGGSDRGDVLKETLIAQGVPVGDESEIVYYEDDIYV